MKLQLVDADEEYIIDTINMEDYDLSDEDDIQTLSDLLIGILDGYLN
jgi:hypothetical protein|tara:strand:- start:201 stop:341 length:141 start_codon:yes stop_codon:yes gene_type:complete